MSPRRGDPKQKQQSSGLPTWLILVGVGALAVVAALVLFNLQTTASPAPAAPSTLTASSGRTKGDPNAKIEFIEWSDYQ
jgi:hypothetical protein